MGYRDIYKNKDIIAARLPVAIPMGEHKMIYLPCKKGKSKKFKGFSVLLKKEGKFEGLPRYENTKELLKEVNQIAVFDFKNKTSINTLIKMLEFFRDNEWNKTEEEFNYER